MKDSKAKILYVEDDQYLSFVTKDNLEIKGFEILCCEDGEKALQCFSSESFDLCILDVMLPRMDGFTLAQKIRKANKEIPILFLSAKSLKEDRIKGLSLGGDDYIVKPFSIEELILKIEVFLKRSKVEKPPAEKPFEEIGAFTLDNEKYILIYHDEEKRLTRREADLLKFFIRNKNKILEREEILNNVWGDDSYFVSRTLDVFISRLRKYLKKDKSIQIRNVHGVGFIMEIDSVDLI